MQPPISRLIIGAQKAGTTTLYHDLRAVSPSASETSRKEPDTLSTEWRGLDAALEFYSSYGHAGRDLIDFSTTYSMRDRSPETAARAVQVNPSMRIVYLVRDPIERAISHHNHLLARGRASVSLEAACEDPGSEVLLHGRYAYQLQPWLEQFPADSVLVVAFDSYVSDRLATVRGIADHLNLDSMDKASLELDTVHNKTRDTAVVKGATRVIHDSQIYRTVIRPRIPAAGRRLGTRILGKVPNERATASPQLMSQLAKYFLDDTKSLVEATGVGQNWIDSWESSAR